MEEIRDTQKKYCSQAMIIAIAGAVVLIIFGEKAIGKGLLLGALFSTINFIIMGQLITLKLGKSRSKVSALALISVLFRFAILAIPLIASLKFHAIHFAGVAVGLFMVQLTILFNNLILNRITLIKKA
ncbi:ATP synthase subunit I [Thermodesulfobacteriota bacterium]